MLLATTFFIIFTQSQASVWDDLTATIAVVEYQPVQRTKDLNDTINGNIEQYQQIISTQAVTNLDLIVFPEATIENNPATSVEVTIGTTCESTECPNILKILAEAARQAQTYIVVNLVEKEQCQSKDCQFHYYNTDVVFARNGTIIARYRKYNLFGEYDLTRPVAEEVIFETDFGVRFGIFTCFDILFKTPAQDLVSRDIDGVIFPTMWFSELPFLTAVQTQQMWAETHNVTLFAAGANNPRRGSGGSGIYGGSKGALSSGIVAGGGTQTFVYKSDNGEVTFSPEEEKDVDGLAKKMDDFKLIIDPSLVDYSSEVLDTSVTDPQTVTLCYDEHDEKFCCHFDITMSFGDLEPNSKFYTYLLVAYSGVRSFTGVYNGGIEICAVLACLNSSLSSCGQRFDNYDEIQWPVTFDEISIRADFEKSENKTQFPNSLLSSIRPIDVSETEWRREEVDRDGTKVMEGRFSLKKSQNRLLTFSIFGRNFELDGAPNSGRVLGTTWLYSFVVFVCHVLAKNYFDKL